MTTQIKIPHPIDLVPDISNSNLVGAWLNKKVSGAKDFSSNGNDGIATDVKWLGTGGYFNGSTSMIDCDATLQTAFDGSFSISMWIRPDDGQPSNQEWVFGVMEAPYNDYVQVGINTAGKLKFQYASDGDSASALSNVADFSNGQEGWHYVVFVADSTVGGVGGLAIYLNGSLVTLASAPNDGDTSGITFGDFAITINPYIGGRNLDDALSEAFAGDIKDVRIYSEAKSSDWILNEFQKGVPDDSIILDVLDGTEDLCVKKHTLTAKGDAVVGKEIKCDGNGDYVDCNTTDTGSFGTGEFTLMAWIKAVDTSTRTILAKRDNLVVSGYWQWRLNGVPRLFIHDGGLSNVGANTSITTDIWHHVAVRRIGSTITFFLDGVSDGAPSSSRSMTNTDALKIGWGYSDATSFNGIIKDAKMMDEGKSDGWISEYYNRTEKFY